MQHIRITLKDEITFNKAVEMRFKTSLMILSIVVIVGLAVIEGNLFVSMNAVNAFQNVKAEANAVTEEFRKFWLYTERLITYYDFGEGLEDWKKRRATFMDALNTFISDDRHKAMARREEDRKSLKKLQDLTALLIQALDRAETAFDEFDAENPNVNQGLIYEQLVKHDYLAGLARKEINNLSVYFDGSIDKALINLNTELDARGSQIRLLMMGVSLLIGIVIGVIIIIQVSWFRKVLTRNLSSIQMGINRLSAGDFSELINVPGKSEFADISQGVNKVIEDISDILHGLQKMSVEATELRDDVSSSTEESTAAITQMSANITSITFQIDRLIGNLNDATIAIQDIAQRIESFTSLLDGQAVSVNQSTAAMEEIKASIQNVSTLAQSRQEAFEHLIDITQNSGGMLDDTNALVKANAEDVENIVEIIGLINNIAQQTDILSMNAAIEAAHAGEYGRGFAVVAEEIRKLAEDTNENSKVIQEAIETIADRIGQVHEASEVSRKAFEEIEKETKDTGKVMSEITVTMQELSSGSGEVMNAMTQINDNSVRIKEDSEGINSGIQRINENFSEIAKAGELTRTGVGEVEVGVREINKAMIEVNELNKKSNESIEMISEGIQRFKILGSDNMDDETNSESAAEKTEEYEESSFTGSSKPIDASSEDPDEPVSGNTGSEGTLTEITESEDTLTETADTETADIETAKASDTFTEISEIEEDTETGVKEFKEPDEN